MKSFKSATRNLSFIVILSIFTNCGSSQKMEQTAPILINEPYFQKWITGVQEGGSGFDIYLPVDQNSDVVLQEAYFKDKKVSLEYKKDTSLYIGHYKYPQIKKQDMVMSDDPKKEYGNPIPVLESKIPFELKENECVITYTKNGKQEFFKLKNLLEKETKVYPATPRD